MLGRFGRAVRRTAWRTAALTAVLAVAATAAVRAAEDGQDAGREPRAAAAADAAGAQAVAPGPVKFPLFALKSDGHLYDYEPKGTGGYLTRIDMGGGFSSATAIVSANVSDSGKGNDLYYRIGNTLYYTSERGNDTKVIGNGWGDLYNLLVSVGNMGGTAQPDLLARDTSGQVWLYQGKADGTFQTRIRMKNSTGWNGMSKIAGRGDYTGDGIADVMAVNSSGNVICYPGTGNATADAVLNATTVTAATGFGSYVAVFSTGDNNGDGKTDLLAADSAGALWLYPGTGSATAPLGTRTQIGTSGWNGFTLLS